VGFLTRKTLVSFSFACVFNFPNFVNLKCTVNVTSKFQPIFYIFRGEHMHKDDTYFVGQEFA
jgi:hypothetical protein